MSFNFNNSCNWVVSILLLLSAIIVFIHNSFLFHCLPLLMEMWKYWQALSLFDLNNRYSIEIELWPEWSKLASSSNNNNTIIIKKNNRSHNNSNCFQYPNRLVMITPPVVLLFPQRRVIECFRLRSKTWMPEARWREQRRLKDFWGFLSLSHLKMSS